MKGVKRPRMMTPEGASLVPEPIRLLAAAMIEHAKDDLELACLHAKSFREPDTARSWLHRATDRPLSAIWCEQVTGISLDRLRRKYPVIERKGPATRRRVRSEGNTQGVGMDAALAKYGLR